VPAINDGVLQTADGNTVTATYVDIVDPIDTTNTTATMFTAPTAAVGRFTDVAGGDRLSYVIAAEGIFATVADDDENATAVSAQTVSVTVANLGNGDTETVVLTGDRPEHRGLPQRPGEPALGQRGGRRARQRHHRVRGRPDDPALVHRRRRPRGHETDTAAMLFSTPSTTRFTDGAGADVLTYVIGWTALSSPSPTATRTWTPSRSRPSRRRSRTRTRATASSSP